MTMTKPTSEQVTNLAAATSAVLRNVSDKLNDLASVKDFGAVGNGVADDTAALQAAFDYATNNGKGLFFPGGTYRVTSTLIVNQNNLANLFLGDGAATIRWYGSDTATDMIRVYNAVQVTFMSLQFRGNTNQTLLNFRTDVIGFPRPDGRGATFPRVSNCEFRGGKYQLRWTAANRDFNNDLANITQCSFIEYTFAGISIEHSNALWHRVDGCVFGSTSGPATWAINTMDDQGGNSYDPTYTGFGSDPGFGGSGVFITGCRIGGTGFLRLGGMRYATYVTDCVSEGLRDFVYTPTGKQTFTASIASGNTTVSNVTNIAQLAPNDYFWNRHVPIGTKIVSIDPGMNSLVLDTAPTGTQANSICDAGLNSSPAPLWQLYVRNMNSGWSDTANAVNQLIAVNAASMAGTWPFVVNFENLRLSGGGAQQPMFVMSANKRGRVELHDSYGEPAPIQIDNCLVTAYSLASYGASGAVLLTNSCKFDSSTSLNPAAELPNCYVEGTVLFTQRAVLGGTSATYLPGGSVRQITNAYPAAPQNITAISGIPAGQALTIYFGGQLTLVHSAALTLAGSANVTPPSGGSITFRGTTAGVAEVTRDFNTYRADVTDTAANIASIASTVNTVGKYAGKVVWDSTNNRLMRSDGSSAGSAWRVIDGSASVTPS